MADVSQDISVEIHRANVQSSWILTETSAIERLKDGTIRTVLADELSAPLLLSVSFTNRVERPYGRAILEVNWPYSLADKLDKTNNEFFGTKQPAIGDWVVIKCYAPNRTTGESPSTFMTWPAVDGKMHSNPPKDGDKAQAVNCFMGVVTRISSTQRALGSGQITHSALSVEVESWFDFLGRVQLGLLVTAEGDGTLYSRAKWLKTWQLYIENNAASLRSGACLGEFLQILLRMAARVKLPGTLFKGKFLGDIIRVCYYQEHTDETFETDGADQRTRQFIRDWGDGTGVEFGDNYRAQVRRCEKVIGWQWLGPQSVNPQGSNVLDLITGSFMADRYLMEMFPSMEAINDQSMLQTQKLKVGPVASVAVETTALDVLVGGLETVKRSGGIDVTDTAGWCPVLIYRMRPWRVEPCQKFRDRRTTHQFTQRLAPGQLESKWAAEVMRLHSESDSEWLAYGSKSEAEQKEFSKTIVDKLKGKADEILKAGLAAGMKLDPRIGSYPATFGRYATPNDVEHRFFGRHIYEISMSKHIDQHFTAATIDIQNDAYGMMGMNDGLMQLPMVARIPMLGRGFKLFKAIWPFWSFPDAAGAGRARRAESLMSYWKAIALTAWQFVGPMYQMVSGSARVIYAPNVNPGCAVEFQWEFFPQFALGSGKANSLYAYIDAVDHVTSVSESGAVDRYTVIQFSRGLFNEPFDKMLGSQDDNPRANVVAFNPLSKSDEDTLWQPPSPGPGSD